MSEHLKPPFVVMGVGTSGAGKTTLLKPFADQVGAQYLSSDEIRAELTGDESDQSVHSEVWETLYHRAAEHLEQGASLVVDATHAKPDERRAAVEKYRDFGAVSVIALVIETDIEQAKARNHDRAANGGRFVPEHAIERMHRQIQKTPPTSSEGFDEIVRTRK